MIDIYEMLGCTPETVTDNDIEDLKRYEEADSYPPRFKVQFSPVDSQSAPDISKLSDLVGAEIPAKWELFGVQVGLKQSYLDCLRDEHHDSKIQFIHLFKNNQ